MRMLRPIRPKIPGAHSPMLYLIILPALLGVGIILWLIFRPDVNSSQPPLKQIASENVDAASLSGQDISMSAVLRSADGKPLTNNKLSSGEAVKVTITIVNNSSSAEKFITVDTGLSTKNFVYSRDFVGISSETENTGTIVLHNIVIEPGQTQELSFVTTPFATKKYAFTFQASAYNANKTLLQRSAAAQYTITANPKPPDQVVQTTNE